MKRDCATAILPDQTELTVRKESVISALGPIMMCPGTTTNASAFANSSWALSTQRFHRCQQLGRRPRLHSIHLPVKPKAALVGPTNSSVEWVSLNKGKVSEFLDFTKMDVRSRRGVIISQNKSTVLKGTELAEFPEATFLTPAIAGALLEKECEEARDASLNLGEESLFALYLLVERSKQERSEYHGLLEALPDVGELDSPDFWSDEELEILRGSPVYSKSLKIRGAIEEEWNNLNTKLFERNRNRFPEKDFSLGLYRWALGIVDSRTVSAISSEPRVLAPILLNLKPPVGGTKATARVEMSGGMFFSKKRVVLTLGVDVSGGDEVTVSSGEGSYNSDYMLERGIVVADGASKFEISCQLTRLDRFYDDKLDILAMAGLEGSVSFDMMEPDKNGKWEAPENMEAFLRLLCLSGADAFLLEGVFRGEVWGFMGLPVSAENEKAICEVMIGTCEDALEEYSRGLEREGGDEEVGSVFARRRDMAKTVVQGEKKVVLAALKSYKGRLGSLDALEYYAERRLKMLDLLRPVDESEIVDSESGGRIGRAFDENY